MTATSIIVMILGLTVTWGGLAFSLYVQIRESNKQKTGK